MPDEFLRVVRRVDEMRLRLKFMLQQSPTRWKGVLRRSTFARSIQGSNSIDGFQVTVDDAAAAVDGEEPLDEKTEAWYAVRGYREAMTYILQIADDPHFVYHEAVLRALHFMMSSYDMASHPGRWRPGAPYVKREETEEIVYVGPDASEVPGLVAQLVDQLNAGDAQPTLVRAALAHLNLAMIQPYSDGNGRMARALQTLVLAREGILDPAFSSIEEYLGHNTQAYYAALVAVRQGAWHPEHDALPWVKYCLTAHLHQAATLLRRTQQTGRLAQILEDEVQRRGLHERTVTALLDAAYGYRVRNATYRKSVDVSDAVSSRDLGALANTGLLVPHGAKRGRYYLAGEWVRQQRAATDLPNVQTDPFSGDSDTKERCKHVTSVGVNDE